MRQKITFNEISQRFETCKVTDSGLILKNRRSGFVLGFVSNEILF